jgi:hypothetical protein
MASTFQGNGNIGCGWIGVYFLFFSYPLFSTHSLLITHIHTQPTMGAYDFGASIRFLMMHANANLGTWIAFPSKNLKKVRTPDMMIMITIYMLLFQGHEQQQLGNVELGHASIVTAFVLLFCFVICSFFRYEIFRWTQYSPMIRSVHSVTGHNYVNSRPPPMLNLTDGGHVNNLGILPLFWRKCDIILCSDAGRDPNFEFVSICNALGLASEAGIIRVKKCPRNLKDRIEVANWCTLYCVCVCHLIYTQHTERNTTTIYRYRTCKEMDLRSHKTSK